MAEPESLIPPHGGYRSLKSFQVAQLAYDVTVRFCNRYVERSSRTHDQMVQAARSGVQNIAEGGKISGTSKKMELKLTNIANGSLDDLRLDYEDFLRQRGLPLWPKEDPRRASLIARRCTTAEAGAVAAWVREVHDGTKPFGKSSPTGPNSGSSNRVVSIPSTPSTQLKFPTYAEIAANAAHTLIVVAASLLNRQTAAQARAFEQEGGFTERLQRVRSANRKKHP